MRNEIETMEMPGWLAADEFTFNARDVLERSLYYPCSGFDGDPVKYFMGNVYSFIYVDYDTSREALAEEIERRGFGGYRVIHRQSLEAGDLAPGGWTVCVPPNKRDGDPDSRRDRSIEPFAEWLIFEREEGVPETRNPKRFSLVYLCADGAAAYQALYLSGGLRPEIVAIIQPGTGFGGNWTDFEDRQKIFARTLFHDPDLLPSYIVNREKARKDSWKLTFWSGFEESVCRIPRAGGWTLVVWKRSDQYSRSWRFGRAEGVAP